MTRMLTRINNNEISILPAGLGNNYPTQNHLVPPGRTPFNYSGRPSLFSTKSSTEEQLDNPEAPAANVSFRSQTEYFGADVLVIIGVILASGGAILTLVSFYSQFRHPAIQATIAGIGPSLIGIGMLFCVLRLFFCSFFTTRTCCECIGDCFTYCYSYLCANNSRQKRPAKQKVHPLKTNQTSRPVVNGDIKPTRSYPPPDRNGNQLANLPRFPYNNPPVEMITVTVTKPPDPSPIPSLLTNETALAIGRDKGVKETVLTTRKDDPPIDHATTIPVVPHLPQRDDEDILKDEIAKLDKRLASTSATINHNQCINDLVLYHSKS